MVVKTPEKILYVSDCLCLYQGQFRPNGRFKPDADWQTDDDRKAADHGRSRLSAARRESRPGERIETPLAGLWQVCRYDEQEVVDRAGPTKALPDAAAAYWMSIPVPGNKFEVKPELRFCHRFVYRTRVNVPAGLAGRSFFLRFPSLSMIASVLVNGQFCGWTKAPFAQWECDVTSAVRPGQVNEVCVVIKDSYYAFSEKKAGKSCRMSFNMPVAWMGTQNWVNQFFDFPIGSGLRRGSRASWRRRAWSWPAASMPDVFVQAFGQEEATGPGADAAQPVGAGRKVQILNEVVPSQAAQAGRSHGRREGVRRARKVDRPAARPAGSRSSSWPSRGRTRGSGGPTTRPCTNWSTTIKLDGRAVDVRRDDVRLPRVGVERAAVQAQRRAVAALGRLHGRRRRQGPRGGHRPVADQRPEHVAVLGPAVRRPRQAARPWT